MMDMRFSGIPRFLVGFAAAKPASNDLGMVPELPSLRTDLALISGAFWAARRRRQADRHWYLRVVK